MNQFEVLDESPNPVATPHTKRAKGYVGFTVVFYFLLLIDAGFAIVSAVTHDSALWIVFCIATVLTTIAHFFKEQNRNESGVEPNYSVDFSRHLGRGVKISLALFVLVILFEIATKVIIISYAFFQIYSAVTPLVILLLGEYAVSQFALTLDAAAKKEGDASFLWLALMGGGTGVFTCVFILFPALSDGVIYSLVVVIVLMGIAMVVASFIMILQYYARKFIK